MSSVFGCFRSAASSPEAQQLVANVESGAEEIQSRAASASWDVYAAVAALVSTEALVVTCLLLGGFGAPDRGRAFHRGHDTFSNDIASILSNAAPDPAVWDGESAQLYAESLKVIQEAVQDMAIADGNIAAIVDRQAGQVMRFRETLVELQGIVVGAISFAGIIYLHYLTLMDLGNYLGASQVAAALKWFSLVTVTAVLGTIVGDIAYTVLPDAEENKNEILPGEGGGSHSEYWYIAENLRGIGAGATFAASQSTVSDFARVADHAVGQRSQVDVTGVVNDSQGRIQVGGVTRNIAPALERLNQTPNQASTFSKQVSPGPNFVNQTHGEAQQRIPQVWQLTSQTYPSPSGQSKTADRNAAPAEATNATGLEGNVTPGGRDTAGAAATEDTPTGLPIDLASLISTERLQEPDLAQLMGFG